MANDLPQRERGATLIQEDCEGNKYIPSVPQHQEPPAFANMSTEKVREVIDAFKAK